MTMTLKQKRAALSPARRKNVRARTAELIAEEQSRRDLRHALMLARKKMAMRPSVKF